MDELNPFYIGPFHLLAFADKAQNIISGPSGYLGHSNVEDFMKVLARHLASLQPPSPNGKTYLRPTDKIGTQFD